MAADCVLVVDDDKDIREGLIELLEAHGFRAVGAENGRTALDLLEKMPCDRMCLILLDLMMPVMDGPTFREEQMKRERLAGIPVVVMTAFRQAYALKAMRPLGCLQKPMHCDDVLRTVKQYCARNAWNTD